MRIANPGLAPRGRGLSALKRASSSFHYGVKHGTEYLRQSRFLLWLQPVAATGAWAGRRARMAGYPGHVAYANRQARSRSGLRVRLGLALDARARRGLGARPRPVAEHARPR